MKKLLLVDLILFIINALAFPDSLAIVKIGELDTPGKASGIAIRSNCVYLADGSGGLRIIDVSNPYSPSQIGSCGTPGFAYDLALAGNYAYVASGTGGLRIIDISDSTNPYEIGFLDTPGQSYCVAIKDTLTFLADGNNWLRIVNCANPATPFEIGHYIPPQPYQLDPKINYVITSAEYIYVIFQDLNNPYNIRLTKIIRVNISDPCNPVQTAITYLQPAGWNPISGNGLAISDNRLFVSAYGCGGLYCFDISDSSQFEQIGHIYTSEGAYCMTMKDGMAFLSISSTPTNTLSIIDVNNPTNMHEVGVYTQSGLKIMNMACQGNFIYAASDTLGLIVLNYYADTSGVCGGNRIQNHKEIISNISSNNGSISYDVNEACRVCISIYNLVGQRVENTVHDYNGAKRERYRVRGLSSGIYILTLSAKNEIYNNRMLIIK